MTTSKHPPEEILITFADGGAQELRAHIEECRDCEEVVKEYRNLFTIAADPNAWEQLRTPPPDLLDLHDRLREEEAHAKKVVACLPAERPEEWIAILEPMEATVGLVRILLREADDRLGKTPAASVILASSACDIAGSLHGYPPSLLSLVRADSWREHAFALYYVGRFAEGLDATSRAHEFIRDLAGGAYDRARIEVTRSIILSSLGRSIEAIPLVEKAAEVFRVHGDHEKYLSTRTTLGVLLQRIGRVKEALDIWKKVLDDPQLIRASPLAAMVIQNVGAAHTQLDQPLLARQALMEAAARFAELGMRSEQCRAEWSTARLLMRTQLFEEALGRLNQVRAEFEELQMKAEVDLVSLDLVEALLLLDHADVAYEECKALLTSLTKSGLAQSARAQAALAHLREATASRHATVELVQSLRAHLDVAPGAIPLTVSQLQ